MLENYFTAVPLANVSFAQYIVALTTLIIVFEYILELVF